LRLQNATSIRGRDGRHQLQDMIVRSRPSSVGARAIEGPVFNSVARLGSLGFIPKDDAYLLVFVVCSEPIYMPGFKGRKNLGYGSSLIFSETGYRTLFTRSLGAWTPGPAPSRLREGFRVRYIQLELMLSRRKHQWLGFARLMPIWTLVACCEIAVQPVNLHDYD